MAKLQDIASDLGIQNSKKEELQPKAETNSDSSGKKRRIWLDNPDGTKKSGTSSPSKREKAIAYDKLRKNPLNLALFLFDNIHLKNQRVTKKISLKEITDALSITKNSVRTALRFLIKNSIISRVNFELGKEGGAVYKIAPEIYEEIKKIKKT